MFSAVGLPPGSYPLAHTDSYSASVAALMYSLYARDRWRMVSVRIGKAEGSFNTYGSEGPSRN